MILMNFLHDEVFAICSILTVAKIPSDQWTYYAWSLNLGGGHFMNLLNVSF